MKRCNSIYELTKRIAWATLVTGILTMGMLVANYATSEAGQIYDYKMTASETPDGPHHNFEDPWLHTWKITKRDGVSAPNVNLPVTIQIAYGGGLLSPISVVATAEGGETPLACTVGHSSVLCTGAKVTRVHRIIVTVRTVRALDGCRNVTAYSTIDNLRYVSSDSVCYAAIGQAVSIPAPVLYLPILSNE